MSDRAALLRTGLLIGLVLTAVLVWLPPSSGSNQAFLRVHVLDVGQGDALLIETPDGVQALIDGGKDASVLRSLGEILPVRDRTIDLVLATHPDSDHIGGLIEVLDRYVVDTIVTTTNAGDSPAAEQFSEAVAAEGATHYTVRRGQVITLGASTTMTVLWPAPDPIALESNTASIVIQVTYGDIDFLLTGDAPQSVETFLAATDGSSLASEVLKIGHHGSRTSTAPEFLAVVDPAYAVLSYGADNTYGHPHVEVTDLLFNNRIETVSTADMGTITFVSDGTAVWISD